MRDAGTALCGAKRQFATLQTVSARSYLLKGIFFLGGGCALLSCIATAAGITGMALVLGTDNPGML